MNPDFEIQRPQGILKSKPQAVPVKAAKEDTLKDLDIEKELLKQYHKAQELLEYSDDEPLNQRAQTLNSITSILQAIIKSQQELYNVERLKTLENVLISVLQKYPDIKKDFLDEYENQLGAL